MRRKMPLVMVVGLVTGIVLLSSHQLAHGSYSYSGTNDDDTIYFGCIPAPSVPGAYWLAIWCQTGGGAPITSLQPMDTGSLTINGLGGNDHIEAVSNDTKEGVSFDFEDIANLTYSTVILRGSYGNDKIIGTPGYDVISGGDGIDNLDAREGNDILYGGYGNDRLVGGWGDDQLYGQDGSDYLSGCRGNDYLSGGYGGDYLVGDQGNDQLYGGTDNDILVGGTGDDIINGGYGTDSFRARRAANPRTIYDGADHDTDWNDSAARVSIEGTRIRDPYEEWASMTSHLNGVTYHYYTTSSSKLLLSERAAGASILIARDGDIPLGGDFDRDGQGDDVGFYCSDTGVWTYDHNHDASTDETYGGHFGRDLWQEGDRPVVGDFDRDGWVDDVAAFRPGNRFWYYDYDHNDTIDRSDGPWGNAGDIPLAGDFDHDGSVDDVAVFRPGNRLWYYDYDSNATTDATRGPWGKAGDIPIAGDFDRDGRYDDVAVFRSSNRYWYYDYNSNATTDETQGRWGVMGDIPIAGDFDRDGRYDDVAVYRFADRTWYYDYNHNGDSDEITGPWGGLDSKPLCTTHKQYGSSCGYTSLNIVMEHLDLVDHSLRRYYPRDLDSPAIPVILPAWNPATTVDVGYHLSMEHIMYEVFHKWREDDPGWSHNIPDFMDNAGRLNTANSTRSGSYLEIQYDIGNVDWDPLFRTTTGQVQKWLKEVKGVGMTDLAYVANKFSPGAEDATPVWTRIGAAFVSLDHLKAVIRGFIDHNLPLLVLMENGHHYNTIIGYSDWGASFYVYTADPLDGSGRPFYSKPMRWRKILLGTNALCDKAEVIVGLVLYGHSNGCSGIDDWARDIDDAFGSCLLCDCP